MLNFEFEDLPRLISTFTLLSRLLFIIITKTTGRRHVNILVIMNKMNILETTEFKAKVSSVLNRNTVEYGKQFLFDNKEDTCWNSEQGLPQWIDVQFEEEQEISRIEIQFQGGFVGQDCEFISRANDDNVTIQPFYPEDINALQSFTFQQKIKSKRIKLVFNKSTDFFGRIVIYQLKLFNS